MGAVLLMALKAGTIVLNQMRATGSQWRSLGGDHMGESEYAATVESQRLCTV